MLIGVSSCPWESDQKLLQQVYQKYVAIPRADYSSRYSAWSHFLGQYSAMNWQFDIGVMTKISDGYTVGIFVRKLFSSLNNNFCDIAGSILSTIEEVMTVKRALQLRVHPLNPMELVNVLCKKTPVYKEEEEAMTNWLSKTPMHKRRQRAIEQREDEEAEMLAKQASAKTKKQIAA